VSALIEVVADGEFKVLEVQDGDKVFLDPKDGIVHFRPVVDSRTSGRTHSRKTYSSPEVPEDSEGRGGSST
jgi:hypothetical protein